MRQLAVILSSLQALTSDLRLLTFAAPTLPAWRPGQLALARTDDAYLRRAHFLFPAPQTPNAPSLLVSATESVARKAVGAELDLLMPVGNGFALDSSARRLLLVGDDTSSHLPPLIALAHAAIAREMAVTLLVIKSAGAEIDWLSGLLPLDVEFHFAKSFEGALPELISWADQVCVYCAPSHIATLKDHIARARVTARTNFAQAIVAPPLACGFGACLSCAVETTRGRPLACEHGPVFDLMELL